MGALLPLVGKAPAVANPAEKAVLGSSLETFLITSILDTICLPLGGFSATGNKKGRAQKGRQLFLLEKFKLIWTGLTPHSSMGSHWSQLSPRLSSCFRVEGRLKANIKHLH